VPTKKLAEYEAKRDFTKTKEPGARVERKAARALRFVVQEHHARRLHWDLRLEKDGVGVSWAVPKGIPPDPKKNHLAVHDNRAPVSDGLGRNASHERTDGENGLCVSLHR
jgi:bifunctional non-homologous end joining protein LigD